MLTAGFHQLAAMRGDGLRPELLALLARCEALRDPKVVDIARHRGDDFAQAGPNPVAMVDAAASAGVIAFPKPGGNATDATPARLKR